MAIMRKSQNTGTNLEFKLIKHKTIRLRSQSQWAPVTEFRHEQEKCIRALLTVTATTTTSNTVTGDSEWVRGSESAERVVLVPGHVTWETAMVVVVVVLALGFLSRSNRNSNRSGCLVLTSTWPIFTPTLTSVSMKRWSRFLYLFIYLTIFGFCFPSSAFFKYGLICYFLALDCRRYI